MKSIVRMPLRNLFRLSLSASALLAATGCDPRPAVPIVEPGGTAASADSAIATFEVSVEPQEADPREVDVWVAASQPELWESLPGDSKAPTWPRLVAVRTKEDFQARPAGPSAGTADAVGLRGEYAIVDGRLRYRLLEPLIAGGAYRVEFHRSAIPAFVHPGAALTLPIVVWHVVPDILPVDTP
jgi:hypothetical protein